MRRGLGGTELWPLLPPLPLFIASQTAQSRVKNTQQPVLSKFFSFFKCKYFGRRFCFELNTKFYIHQASIQNKRRTQPIQTKQNSWCPFWIKPALLLACSPFWVYFELSAGETKEDGAVWRIRGAEKNTAENGKERENRISLIFERGEVFKRISEWSIGAIKFGYNNWPWRLLIAKWHHTHKMKIKIIKIEGTSWASNSSSWNDMVMLERPTSHMPR